MGKSENNGFLSRLLLQAVATQVSLAGIIGVEVDVNNVYPLHLALFLRN